MSDSKSYFEQYNLQREDEFNMIKKFIDYDKMIDDLIAEKENVILKKKIEMRQLQMNILSLENDIKRIREEHENSNHKYGHIFINPYWVYQEKTKPKPEPETKKN